MKCEAQVEALLAELALRENKRKTAMNLADPEVLALFDQWLADN